jgi:hypothetical protein
MAHLSAAKRVICCLKGTPDFGLLFTKSPLHLYAYCDFKYAGNPSDRQSTWGYGISLGSNLISWQAKKQSVVSCSSTKVEYSSLTITTSELYWLRMLFQELQVPFPVPPQIWCNNMGAIVLASNPIYHARTKHVEVDYHFIREKVLYRDITISHLSTHDQCLDIFTKGLTAVRFLFLRTKLMIVACPISLRGSIKVVDHKDPTEDHTDSANPRALHNQ